MKTHRKIHGLTFAFILMALCMSQALQAQAPPAAAAPAHQTGAGDHLRSRIYVYDLRTGQSKVVFSADTVWEAPNWSPDGKYLISNSGGAIYRMAFLPDGTTEAPVKLAIPDAYRCNNDKAISPDGKQLAFSATLAPAKNSRVFLAEASGANPKLMTVDTPSYFHGWSPDGKTLAFVAQRNGSGQYDIYGVPAAGGAETRLTMNPHQDDGPDYSPDGKWIYINSDRSGKQAVWRFPAAGAGPDDTKAELVMNDDLEDWFPHISPDGSKLIYIGYPAGTPTHNPRDAKITIKLAMVAGGKVAKTSKTLVEATGGQGTLNVNSWAPDSQRFAYVTYENLP